MKTIRCLLSALALILLAATAEASTFMVTNTADSGPGTLRNLVAGAGSGDTIVFTNKLSGQTILLTNGQIILSNSIDIDASGLAGGIQINGNNQSRIFDITNATISLNSLTLTNGNNNDNPNYGGGAIFNFGTLTVNNCTFAGNQAGTNAGRSGAIDNLGDLTVENSSFIGNQAELGGAIGTLEVVYIYESTFVGNSAAYAGGAIYNLGLTVELIQSTIAGNSAGTGGGFYSDDSVFGYGNCSFNNCIVSGNTASSGGPDIYASGPINYGRAGADLIGNNDAAGSLFPSGLPNANGDYVGTDASPLNALLAPPGNYGGPTPTMPPEFGSRAINTAGTIFTTFTTDQRGFPRVSGGQLDIGAVEAQIASTTFQLVKAKRLGNGSIQFSFTNLADGSFTVFGATNLALPFNTWSRLGLSTESPIGSGAFQFTDPQATNYPECFYRVTSP